MGWTGVETVSLACRVLTETRRDGTALPGKNICRLEIESVIRPDDVRDAEMSRPSTVYEYVGGMWGSISQWGY